MIKLDTLLLVINLLVVGISSFFVKSWFVSVKERLNSHSERINGLEKEVAYLRGLKNGKTIDHVNS